MSALNLPNPSKIEEMRENLHRNIQGLAILAPPTSLIGFERALKVAVAKEPKTCWQNLDALTNEA
jgi:hypothetical protein